MVATTTDRSPYNHWRCCGCGGAKALTLADRELITGRSLTQLDEETGTQFCVDYLADLPADGYKALFHVCGEEQRPEPEPAAAVELLSESAVKVACAKVGDVVRYHGALTEYHGGVWEVTCADRRGLRLYRPFEALWNVSPDHVTVVQTRKQIDRIKRRKR